jgi:5' nucleotidase, deoxy (Pyrimidine), cytosolic type C protein (NT5C)
MATIFLDCDGVLADFDGGARRVFGMHPTDFERRFGLKRFWAKLASTPDFFANLDVLPDALELFEAVRHKNPVILTGLPRGAWAEPQKRRWAERHFPGIQVITTTAALKREHCRPGDALVDDRDKYRKLWERAGGIFIHHRNAAKSNELLRQHGFI